MSQFEVQRRDDTSTVRTQARAVQDGRELVLVRGGEIVQSVFTLTGLDRELTMVDAPPPGAPQP